MLMMRNVYRWILAMCDVTQVRSYFKVEIPTHAKSPTQQNCSLKEGLDSLQGFRIQILSDAA